MRDMKLDSAPEPGKTHYIITNNVFCNRVIKNPEEHLWCPSYNCCIPFNYTYVNSLRWRRLLYLCTWRKFVSGRLNVRGFSIETCSARFTLLYAFRCLRWRRRGIDIRARILVSTCHSCTFLFAPCAFSTPFDRSMTAAAFIRCRIVCEYLKGFVRGNAASG